MQVPLGEVGVAEKASPPDLPVSSALGYFMNIKKRSLGQQARSRGDGGLGAVARLASDAWMPMADSEKQPFVDAFRQLVEQRGVDSGESDADEQGTRVVRNYVEIFSEEEVARLEPRRRKE